MLCCMTLVENKSQLRELGLFYGAEMKGNQALWLKTFHAKLF